MNSVAVLLQPKKAVSTGETRRPFKTTTTSQRIKSSSYTRSFRWKSVGRENMIRPKATRSVLIVSIFVLFSCAVGFSQSPGITISRGSQISTDNAKYPHFESFLAVNPKNPNHWLASAIMIGRDSEGDSYPYVSRDGGRTWRRGQMKRKDERIFKGPDPIVYFDPEGKIAFFGTVGFAPRGLLLSRSNDGGLTWEDPVTIPGGTIDRPYLAFDHTGGKFNHRIYFGGAVFEHDTSGIQHDGAGIFYSDDGGRTFLAGGFLLGPGQGDEELIGPMDLLVTSDGKLVIPFSTFVQPDKRPGAWMKAALVQSYLWTAISEDGGLSFLPAVKGPSKSIAPGFRYIGSGVSPHAAIDANGPYRDRIYMTWPDFDGKKYVVKEAYSKDLGKTWSTPIVVNDNANDGAPANPGIAVNKDGTVAVIFNDRRDDPNSSCYQLYIAVSTDGGETFLPNIRASEKATCAAAPGNWTGTLASASEGTIIVQGPFPDDTSGGDTQGLVADTNGAFDIAWINGETGVMQLWSKSFTVDRTALPKPRKDISHDLKLDVSEPIVDFEKHLVIVKARLENPTSAPIEGPFTVVLDDNTESFLKDVQVVDADNDLGGKGAAWNFTVGGQKLLAPKQKSDVREFHWAFSGALPERPDDREMLKAHFQILGPTLQ